MSFTELIAGVEDHEKVLTVFNADKGVTSALREQFHDRNISVSTERTSSGRPNAFVVLSDDGEFVTAADAENILEPDEGRTDPGFDGDPYRPILDHLDQTMFTSYDIGQMVAASREIEDRAWRIGKGSLRSGFQRLSILHDQMDIYEQLAEKGSLDVHAYAVPDTEVPEHDTGLTIHVERSDEIERSWFVAYDGAGVDVNKCALLAEEREERSFYGFWTYDPATVDWIIDHLESTYGLIESH
ncbi:histidine kinase [Natronomonas sp. F2-12]|jgi:DICT domain-containing protein|uniref:Histidine kinase n=1 Tax=Natronomonas aquatica TaxID=2841590 RepID=A0A9R1CUI4_9EURY|nr:DICT sensory domain-containing protein [Natronomonas aquatica]MCQ4333796.1 histidine kinase [Natronomonas aquatica]